MISKLISGLISLTIIIWVGIIAYDYYLVTSEKDPKFCLASGTKEYPDGTVEWCKGMGYKAYSYDRLSFKAVQFGPFWIQEQKMANEE